MILGARDYKLYLTVKGEKILMAKDTIKVEGEDVVVREDTAKSYRGVYWALFSVAAFVIIAAILLFGGIFEIGG